MIGGCMKALSIFLLLLFPFAGSVSAQTNAYRFSRIDVDDGLSNNQIKTVFKDHSGFLWIGTISGLNRYDGYSFKVFTNDPADSTSLINSDVNKLFEGPDGKLWIHTWSGLNIYNPTTETFDRNTDRVLGTFGIPPGTITSIEKDRHGNFWFLHETRGLYRYTAGKQSVSLTNDPHDTTSIISNSVASWGEDDNGNIWLVHTNGVLEKIDPVTLRVVYRDRYLKTLFRGETLRYNVMVDSDGGLWIYINNRNAGLFHFWPADQQWLHVDNNTGKPRLNSSIVRGIVEDESGLLWIATDHGGINVLDKNDSSVTYILHNPEDEKSLSQSSINVLYKDQDGIIWAGTFRNGLSYYHKNINRFQLYHHQVTQPESLPFNDINAIAEDHSGNLWIGTNGGGLIYFDRTHNTYEQYLHEPGNDNSLTTNVIVSLLVDRDNKLWIGTYFGGLLSFDGTRFVRYKHDPDNENSISDNSIWEIFQDSGGDLWIGTLTKGVNRFDPDEGVFRHYTTTGSNPIHATYVPEFMEDAAGNIWIGTGYGIDVLERKTGRFVHYLNRRADKGSLSNNSVLSLYQDSRGLIWVGTHGGLNLYDQQSHTFSNYTKADGLPHNSILTILEDNSGDLWVSTAHGISHLKIQYNPGQRDSLNIQFRNYDEKDGLQGIQFNENAACKTSAGELVFAGGNGFNLFKPGDIGLNRNLPHVILTDFQIFDQSVKIGEEVNGKTVLEKAIGQTDEIVLDHSDNVFSIVFASLSQFHPEKVQYRYIMEGFSKEWTTTDALQRRVTYTNLDPGEYIFKVKAANNDGIWNETPTQLKITVLPPFWRSKTAFVLYALGMLGALFLARWLVLHNARINFEIRQAREREHRMHELDMIKIKFFTNVSHEFRTPLSLILAPIEKLLRNTPEGEQKQQFQLIHRNARRLLNLVNQLLDFRKLEVQEVRLNATDGDVVKFVRDVFHSFSDLAEKNNVHLSFHSTVDKVEMPFDHDKLEKILFNLLSNAFKFTPGDGAVEVGVDVEGRAGSRFIKISVKDTGIGIPLDKQEKIFERFFQDDLPVSMVNQGSGIGLSITHEFVKVHGGTIQLESEPGHGSCFTVLLPLEASKAVAVETAPVAVSPVPVDPDGVVAPQRKKPVLLIVEDNEDFRFYLKDNLKLQYTIVEAKNGREGLERALAGMPDLIVSDIMMPEMNGVEMCRRIRSHQRTSHIPVIMLTARTAEEQKIDGFSSGASDYVTKPFNFEILQSRIHNLIAQRDAFQKAFARHLDVKATDIQITSLDEKLIARAISVVEKNMGEPDFTVEKFSRELGMSRVHLYKKLLSLTGKTPIEFIRMIRLQRAAQLLEKSQLSVAEIAYQVGFNNPRYFSKYFKDQFNILPSAYAGANR